MENPQWAGEIEHFILCPAGQGAGSRTRQNCHFPLWLHCASAGSCGPGGPPAPSPACRNSGLSAVLPLLGMARGQDTERFLLKEIKYLEKMEEHVVCHHPWLLTGTAND